MLYCKLNNRSLISFIGRDVTSFLQGIITNDINKISNNRAIYASLLSPQGKILKDFFLFKIGSKIYLDTTKESLKILEKKLNIYKINQKVKFSKENFTSYYTFYGKSINKVFNLLQKGECSFICLSVRKVSLDLPIVVLTVHNTGFCS